MPFLETNHSFHLTNPEIILEFAPEVLLHFAKHQQTAFWKREAGGQLFGKIDGRRWRVVQATGPRVSDYRRRFRFFPSRTAEQAEIAAMFEDGLHYMGDWHTHPEKKPHPSDMDIESMVELSRRSSHELPGFLMVIVGTTIDVDGIWISLHLTDGQYLRISKSA